MRKGINTSITIVLGLVLAGLVAYGIISASGGIFESGENVNDRTSKEVNDSGNQANCVAKCRAEHPRGGPEFYECRDDNDCD